MRWSICQDTREISLNSHIATSLQTAHNDACCTCDSINSALSPLPPCRQVSRANNIGQFDGYTDRERREAIDRAVTELRVEYLLNRRVSVGLDVFVFCWVGKQGHRPHWQQPGDTYYIAETKRCTLTIARRERHG